MLNEAKYGNFTRLDQILGFASTEKENEMIPIEQQLKMNSIMVNVLKAKGLDFDAIIAESAREKIQRSIQADENKRMEKQRKITKMKLNNQTKLGVVKSVPRKSDPIDAQEKRCKDARKIKTAKDHEHYRKSQRPTRIWFHNLHLKVCILIDFFLNSYTLNFSYILQKQNKIDNNFHL